jgi:hypothetical protein
MTRGVGQESVLKHTFRIVKENKEVNPKHLQVGIILRLKFQSALNYNNDKKL